MNSISKMISFIDKNSVETRIISAKDVSMQKHFQQIYAINENTVYYPKTT